MQISSGAGGIALSAAQAAPAPTGRISALPPNATKSERGCVVLDQPRSGTVCGRARTDCENTSTLPLGNGNIQSPASHEDCSDYLDWRK